jgi:dihydrofolate reductase
MKTPIVSIIVAMSANRGIGRNNDLMWHLPNDMKFFKDKTLGHPVIMGRKNYESIPEKYRPFKNRLNIVISRQANYNAPDCILVQNLSDALIAAKQNEENEVFVIGGGQVYQEALEMGVVDRMYITEVDAVFSDAEVFFPDFDKLQWNQELLFEHNPDNLHEYAFRVMQYERNRLG